MMKGHSNSEYEILVSKYLAGEASPEEAMAIEEWLSLPGNKEQFREMMKVWEKLPGGRVHNIPDVKQAWLQWESKPAQGKLTSGFQIGFQRYWIAASLLLIIVSALVVFLLTQTPQHEVVQQVVIRSMNEVRTDTLPDASVVVISSNSSITYLPDFNIKERNLILSGECFFNVKPSKEKPFIINIEELKIKVVGTSFNVRKLSQPEVIEVQVSSGVVQMISATDQINIIKGQTGIYNKAKGTIIITDSVDANSISYATHRFAFTDNSLEEVATYLEKAFSVSIEGEKDMLSTCRLTAHFENQSLKYILDVIAATLNITYRIEGKTVHLIGKGCL